MGSVSSVRTARRREAYSNLQALYGELGADQDVLGLFGDDSKLQRIRLIGFAS